MRIFSFSSVYTDNTTKLTLLDKQVGIFGSFGNETHFDIGLSELNPLYDVFESSEVLRLKTREDHYTFPEGNIELTSFRLDVKEGATMVTPETVLFSGTHLVLEGTWIGSKYVTLRECSIVKILDPGGSYDGDHSLWFSSLHMIGSFELHVSSSWQTVEINVKDILVTGSSLMHIHGADNTSLLVERLLIRQNATFSMMSQTHVYGVLHGR